MQEGPTIRIGLVAEIAPYAIQLVGDSVTVTVPENDQVVTTQAARGLARFVRRSKDPCVVLADFPDFEVVYIFDRAQDGYGYAVNLQVPMFSEWGYASIQTLDSLDHN